MLDMVPRALFIKVITLASQMGLLSWIQKILMCVWRVRNLNDYIE